MEFLWVSLGNEASRGQMGSAEQGISPWSKPVEEDQTSV